VLQFVLVTVAGLFVTQAAVIATSVYLHRGLAHRALTLHPVADWLFRCVLWITTGQNRREWVAVHRKHHAFTDREGDPHSPLLHGFWKIQLGNVYYYVREARNPETIARWAKDIKEDMWDRLFFNWGTMGGLVGVVLAMLVFGPLWGFAMALTHFVLYVFALAPAINGLGHWWGRKNFGTNNATNIRLLAWLTGGESLHNNHHAYPSSPKFSMGRFEFDPSWVVIKLLVALRLVSLVSEQRSTPRRVMALGKGPPKRTVGRPPGEGKAAHPPRLPTQARAVPVGSLRDGSGVESALASSIAAPNVPVP
jgi:stearoyl-CoA desaturase (Delta-9 desaturase)